MGQVSWAFFKNRQIWKFQKLILEVLTCYTLNTDNNPGVCVCVCVCVCQNILQMPASCSKVPEPSCRECRPSGTKSNSIKSDTVFTKSFISCKGLTLPIDFTYRMRVAKIRCLCVQFCRMLLRDTASATASHNPQENRKHDRHSREKHKVNA